MPEVSSVTLASGLTLSCVDRGGRSASALILLPGPTDSWRCYEPVLSHLPTSLRAIPVSQRGHGDSDKPDTGYGVEDFAADLGALLDALGLDRAVVAGHSGAALVARRFALDHPDRVLGLVLEGSPTSLRGDPGLEDFLASVLGRLTDPVDPDLARRVIADTTGDLPTSFAEEMVQETLKVPARVWRETFAGLLEYDDTAELTRLVPPALLVSGAADDLVAREKQDLLLGLIPRAELMVYEGVGHSPHWEEPRRYAADVAAFVERVAGGSG